MPIDKEIPQANLLSVAERIIWNAAVEEAIERLVASQQFIAANTLESMILPIQSEFRF